MGTQPVIPPKLQQQLVEEHGKDSRAWPEELRDLLDPTISVEQMGAPMSGRIGKVLDTSYTYFWAGPDRDGQSPTHERVESLRAVGWLYATTNDVKMAAEDVVKGRNPGMESKDGGNGFSDEIRSGDRRLMKLPMAKWRSLRKGQNLAAYQMAYPQGLGESNPMTSAMLKSREIGIPTYIADDVDVNELRGRSNDANTSMTQDAREKLARRTGK